MSSEQTIKHINSAVDALNQHLKDVYTATDPLNQERQALHLEIVTAIHTIEDHLASTLNGSFLRGASNLLINDRRQRYERNGRIIESVRRTKLFGWNVRRNNKTACIRIPADIKEITTALVLIPEGAFAIAEVSLTAGLGDVLDRVRFEICDPDPEDFKIEDLSACIDTVVQACAQHVRKSERTSVETAKVKRLAEAVQDTLNKLVV